MLIADQASSIVVVSYLFLAQIHDIVVELDVSVDVADSMEVLDSFEHLHAYLDGRLQLEFLRRTLGHEQLDVLAQHVCDYVEYIVVHFNAIVDESQEAREFLVLQLLQYRHLLVKLRLISPIDL
jgi:hypothetical protein